MTTIISAYNNLYNKLITRGLMKETFKWKRYIGGTDLNNPKKYFIWKRYIGGTDWID